ncbi:MAG: outer membrane protein transport protein [Burkholderiaceae bacterium]|nr:outer membrane protein transport protein [Burkholderiaceae bacterium]
MRKKLAFVAFASLAAPAAQATDGYFQPGYSIKSNGMGGVGIALPQDALAAATNPAGMALIGNRVDGGLSLFKPDRSVSTTGSLGAAMGPAAGTPINGTYSGNDQSLFLIPEVGMNWMLNPRMAVGVSLYGNGGMNSGYANIFPPLQPGTGVDLQQMFISPSFAVKLDDNNAVGIALNLVQQTFRANGLGNFKQYSVAPDKLTDNDHDTSTGVGVRLGWTGTVAPGLTLGATWQPETRMSSFNKYAGLFAGGAHFNIPETYGVGFAWTPAPQWTLAGDVVRINYAKVKAIGNTADCFYQQQCLLGQDNGPAFGWSNITVIKLGAAYQYSPDLTLRAGWNHSDNPVQSSQVFLNTIAPAVTQDHLTLGATYALRKDMEISVDYVHALQNSVTGPLPPGFATAGSTETVRMNQNTLGVSVGWMF